MAIRGEGGVRLNELWVVGGVILTENRPTGAPTALDDEFLPGLTGDAAGVYAGLRGPVWGGFSVDVTATRWNKTAAAKRLGISFRALRYRLKKLGME